MKFARLYSGIQSFSEVKNHNLLKVKIRIQHDGANKNGTKFSLINIRKAEKTLRNIPILAYIKRDENGEALDFDQHNMVQKVVKVKDGYDLVINYLERPIGVIPTETEITYEEIDGKTYLCATGYIWKRYANEGFDILMDSSQKGVSMEIEIHKGQKDKEDDLYDVQDYSFLGVTCLGDDVESGMFDTTITKYTASKSYKRELEDIYKEIFSLENGKEDIMPEEIKETVEVTEEATEEVVEEVTTEEFTEETPVIEEVVEEVKSEEIAEEIVEENVEAEITEEAAVEEVVETTEEEVHSVDELVEKLGTKEIELNALKETVATYEEELKTLREFKAVKDREALENEVYQIVSEFTLLDEAEIEGVKSKVLNNEMTTKEFKRELTYLVGVKALAGKDTYTAKETVKVVPVIPVVKEAKTDEYGGLLKKHNLI